MLSLPPPAVISAVGRLAGDYVLLGCAGKMGISTARMLRRALEAAGRRDARVIAVSRFSRPGSRDLLAQLGIETVACDLLDAAAVACLPLAENVIFLAGQKFGGAAAPGEMWMQNTHAPALAARHYAGSRIVVFSTGCVYPFVPVEGPGADETTTPDLGGEYAASCLGRERVFDYHAERFGTRVLHYRLNYAVELRYGVLVDVALKVAAGEPVDVTTGHFNCIWQADASACAIQCLEHTAAPARVLNVTGLAIHRVRDVAQRFAEAFGLEAHLSGTEAPTAWLADASAAARLFGPPEVSLDTMISRIAEHLRRGGHTLGKPTHFETRSGRF